jgi:sugar phosphate isomerase/epimerase
VQFALSSALSMYPTMKTSNLLLSTLLAATVAGTPLAVQATPIPDEYKIGGFAIGCQAYTFNRFTVFEAIEKTAQAGGKIIEFYPGQRLSPAEPDVRWGHDASDDAIAKVKAKLKEHNILAVNYGVVGVPRDEAGARRIFEFAKKMGIRAITTESTDAIDTVEKLVKEFDIRVAYHNHPVRPNDPNYKIWDPKYVADLVRNRDRRIGASADTGHWIRSNLDPVESLKILEGRIISSHLKDLNRKGPGAHDVPFGTGVANIAGVLDELKRQGFDGNLSIEYEHNWDNNVPEVAQCVGFVRGYTAGRK